MKKARPRTSYGGRQKRNEPPPSELMLLRRKLDVHCDAIEIYKSSESHEYHARMVRRLCKKIARAAKKPQQAPRPDRKPSKEEADEFPLADLPLSPRMLDALDRRGVFFAGQLREWTEADLRTIPMCGAKMLKEIREALAALGVSLKSDTEEKTASKNFVSPNDNGVVI